MAEKAAVAVERLTKLEADRPPLALALEQAQASYESLQEKFHAAESALVPVSDELTAARGKVAEIVKKVAEARKGVAEAEAILQKRKEALGILAEAIAKAQQVAAQLPDDKELAASAAKLVEQSSRIAAEMPNFEKAITDKKGAVDATLAELASAKQQMDAVVAKWTPLREPVRAADAELLVARVQMMDAVATLARYDERIRLLKTFIEFKQAEEARASSTVEVASAKSSMATVREEMADQAMAIAQQQLAIAQAEQEKTSVQAQIAAVEKEKTTAHENAKILAEAVTLVESAKSQMFSDPRIEPMLVMLVQKKGEADSGQQSVLARLSELTKLATDASTRGESARQSLAQSLEENIKKFQGAQTVKSTLDQALAKADETESQAGAVENKLQSEWSSDLTLAALKPLSPEQICWSILRITGIEDRYKQAERAELDKSSPLSEEAKKDPAQLAARELAIERGAYTKLKSAVGGFVAYFAAAGGQPQSDFFATADQALFVSNDGTVNSWIAPAAGNITERIIQQVDPRTAAEDLYLTVLSRRPTEQEISDVAQHLGKRASDKAAAAQELVWALVTSAEFRFNH